MAARFLTTLLLPVLSIVSCASGGREDLQAPVIEEWAVFNGSNYTIHFPERLVKDDSINFDRFAIRFSDANTTLEIERGTSEFLSELETGGRTIRFDRTSSVRMANGLLTRARLEFKKDRTNFEDALKRHMDILSADCENSEESTVFMVLYMNSSDRPVAEQILNSVDVRCSDRD